MFRSRNPHSLTDQPKRHSQQPEHAHDHPKDPKWESRPGSEDPVSDEKRPRESNGSPHNRSHDEAVAMQRAVRVNDLLGISAGLATVVSNLALHS